MKSKKEWPRTKVLINLRSARGGWLSTAEKIFSLQDIDDELIDELWPLLSASEQRELVRHLNAVWRKHKNENLAYTFALISKSIELLESGKTEQRKAKQQ